MFYLHFPEIIVGSLPINGQRFFRFFKQFVPWHKNISVRKRVIEYIFYAGLYPVLGILRYAHGRGYPVGRFKSYAVYVLSRSVGIFFDYVYGPVAVFFIYFHGQGSGNSVFLKIKHNFSYIPLGAERIMDSQSLLIGYALYLHQSVKLFFNYIKGGRSEFINYLFGCFGAYALNRSRG